MNINMARKITQTISSFLVLAFFIWVFFVAADQMTRLVNIPFLIIAIISVISCSSELIKEIIKNKYKLLYETNTLDTYKEEDKMEKTYNIANSISKIVEKIVMINFLLIWFGSLILWNYNSIKMLDEGGLKMLVFSLIFWVPGIYILYTNFIKKA